MQKLCLQEHGDGSNAGEAGGETKGGSAVGLLGVLLNLGRLGLVGLGGALNTLTAVGDGQDDRGVGSDNGTSGGDGDGSLGDGGGLDGGGLSRDGGSGGLTVLEHGSSSEGDTGLTADVGGLDGVDEGGALGGGAGGPLEVGDVDVVSAVDLNVSSAGSLGVDDVGTVAELDGLAVGEEEHVLDLVVGGLVRAANDELLTVRVDGGVLDVGAGSDGDDTKLLGSGHRGGGGEEGGGELHCNECGV